MSLCSCSCVVTKAKTIELVVAKHGVGLWHKAVEEIGSTTKINENFERYHTFTGLVDC